MDGRGIGVKEDIVKRTSETIIITRALKSAALYHISFINHTFPVECFPALL